MTQHTRWSAFGLGFALSLLACGDSNSGDTTGSGGGATSTTATTTATTSTGTPGTGGNGGGTATGGGGSGTGGAEPVEDCTDAKPGCVVKSDKARETNPSVTEADREALRAGNLAFALDLQRELQDSTKNTFVSPYSVTTALAMTYVGAKGDTQAAMAEALRFTLAPEKLHPALNRLALDLAARGTAGTADGGKGFKLRSANSIWSQVGYPLEAAFLDTLAVSYGSSVRLVDYKKPDEAATFINTWVSANTDGLIPELVSKDDFNEESVLTLVNAILFKAAWASPFEKSETKPGAFTKADGTTVQAAMMHGFDTMLHASTEAYDAVALAYDRAPLSMLVVVPKAGTVDAFEAGLDQAGFDQLVAGMTGRDVTLSLPKFKFEYTTKLKETLTALGMGIAFERGKADLTGISQDGDPPFIQQVIHKAFIGIDEAGTEAAAATAVIVGASGSGVEPESATLDVDRPFLVFIRDEPTGTILFSGRVNDPTAN